MSDEELAGLSPREMIALVRQLEVRLRAVEGEWVAAQSPGDIGDDPQVKANGYLDQVEMANGTVLPMVTPPIQFDDHEAMRQVEDFIAGRLRSLNKPLAR